MDVFLHSIYLAFNSLASIIAQVHLVVPFLFSRTFGGFSSAPSILFLTLSRSHTYSRPCLNLVGLVLEDYSISNYTLLTLFCSMFFRQFGCSTEGSEEREVSDQNHRILETSHPIGCMSCLYMDLVSDLFHRLSVVMDLLVSGFPMGISFPTLKDHLTLRYLGVPTSRTR